MLLVAGRCVISFLDNDNAALKSKWTADLIKGMKSKWELTAREVGDHEDTEELELGFAALIPEDWHKDQIEQFTDKILLYVDQNAPGRVLNESWEILEVL